MKKLLKYMLAVGLVGTVSAGCSILETPMVLDKNNPLADDYLVGATRSQLKELFVGMQARLRTGYAGTFNAARGTVAGNTGYLTTITAFGREGIYYSSQDSRYMTVMMGRAVMDNSSFYHGYYTTFAYARNQAYQAEQAAINARVGELSAGELKAYRGYAMTVQAICMLHHINMLYQNGIRIDYRNPLNPGPFVSYQAGLTEILRLLNEGYSLLSAADSDMQQADLFFFTTGWSDYLATVTSTTSTAMKIGMVNRAFAARVYAYRASATGSAADWAAVLTAVDNSFAPDADQPTLTTFEGDRYKGPMCSFSAAAGEATNPQYYNANLGTNTVGVPSSFVQDAEFGDTRVFASGSGTVIGNPMSAGGTAKIRARTTRLDAYDGGRTVEFNYELGLYATNATPSYMIRGEEMVLLAAEAKYQQGLEDEAQDIINVLRNFYELGAVTPTGTALRDEILKQRRYSLAFEGHRWIDLRRYNLLNAAWVASVKDNTGADYGSVVTQMPKINEEINWDSAN